MGLTASGLAMVTGSSLAELTELVGPNLAELLGLSLTKGADLAFAEDARRCLKAGLSGLALEASSQSNGVQLQTSFESVS